MREWKFKSKNTNTDESGSPLTGKFQLFGLDNMSTQQQAKGLGQRMTVKPDFGHKRPANVHTRVLAWQSNSRSVFNSGAHAEARAEIRNQRETDRKNKTKKTEVVVEDREAVKEREERQARGTGDERKTNSERNMETKPWVD